MKTRQHLLFYTALFLLIAVWSNHTIAQGYPHQDTDVSMDHYIGWPYELLQDDPDKVGNTYLSLSPFILDISTSNPNISIAAEGGYMYKDMGGIYFLYRRALIDALAEPDITSSSYHFYNSTIAEGTAYHGVMPLQDYELMGYYNFKSWQKVKDVKVKVKSKGNDRYLTLVPAHKKFHLALRLGHQWYSSFYGTGFFGLREFNTINIGSNNFLLGQFEQTGGGTMYRYEALVAGISLTEIYGLKVRLKEYGKRNELSKMEAYLDIVYAYAYGIDDMECYIDGSYPFSFLGEVAPHNPFIPYGMRLGVKEIGLHYVNFCGGFEVGIRPGMNEVKSNIYGMMKLSYSFAAQLPGSK